MAPVELLNYIISKLELAFWLQCWVCLILKEQRCVAEVLKLE